MPLRTDILINDKPFAVLPDGFNLIGEPRLIQQGDIAGSSRPSKSARPDILSWKWDNWSGGEGQRFINSGDPESFTRYQDSDDPVDLSMVGELRRGRDATAMDNSSLTSPTTGFLSLGESGSTLAWFAYNSGANVRVGTATAGGASGVAADSAQVVAAATLRGQPVTANGVNLFVGTSLGIYKSAGGAAGTDWSASLAGAHGNPVISANRLYFTKEITDGIEFYQASLITADQQVLVGTITGSGKSICTCSDGDFVYVLAASSSGDQAFLYRWDGTVLTEFATVPHGFRIASDHIPVMRAVHGIVFVGGFFTGDNTADFDQPTLIYFTESEAGVVYTMKPLSLRAAAQRRITCLEVGPEDTLLIGLESPTGAALTDAVMAYDLKTGGFSHYMRPNVAAAVATSQRVTSIIHARGRTMYTIFQNDTTDDLEFHREKGREGTIKVAGSIWDFDLPDEEKILLSAEVHTSALAAGDDVKLSFVLDDSTTITTDSAGAALTHDTDGASRKSFTLSDSDTERIFRFLEPRIEITGTDATQGSNGPTVYSVTIRAITAGTQQFIEALIDLSDSKGTSRMSSRALTGSKAQEELEALFTSTSNRIFDVKGYIEKPGQPYPRRADTYVCVLHEYAFGYRPGVCRAVFRVIG